MKNCLYLLLGVLLVAALGWAGWQALRQRPEPPVPVYNGRMISYWLLIGDAPPSLRSDPGAVPYLTKALRRDVRPFAAFYRERLWPNLPRFMQVRLGAPPRAEDVSDRVHAADFLGRMGPLAKPAIPALIRMLKTDWSSRARLHAAFALGNVGKGDARARAALLSALRDKSEGVVLFAAIALWQIDPELVASLLREEKSGRVRSWAAFALGHFRRGDPRALALLTQVSANDPDPAVRERALVALAWVEPDPERTMSIIVRLQAAQDATVRQQAAEVLGMLREGHGGATVLLLIGELHDLDDAYPGYKAAEPFVKVDPVQQYIRALKEENPLVKVAAAKTLGDIGKGNSNVTAALTEALKDNDANVRATATNVLLKLDPAAAARTGVR
jgi:HEAT repeat protein